MACYRFTGVTNSPEYRKFIGVKNLGTQMSLVEELEKRLQGGKFRLLNEKLYKKKELTKEEIVKYHHYYEEQARKWPRHPKDMVLDKMQGYKHSGKIADIGCGVPFFSKHFPDTASFDKYPSDAAIIEAELESVPADDKSFSAAVHTLSIMQNYISKVITETNRILKVGGYWYVAEVRSRVTNLRALISQIERFGFKKVEVDVSNSHFCILVFEKVEDTAFEKRCPEVRLSPCLYKKR